RHAAPRAGRYHPPPHGILAQPFRGTDHAHLCQRLYLSSVSPLVIPAEAGIHGAATSSWTSGPLGLGPASRRRTVDPGFRRGDDDVMAEHLSRTSETVH